MSFKDIYKTIAISIIFSISAMAYSAGPVMVEITHTLEEARISVVSDAGNSSGKVTATLLECSGCTPKTYLFDSATVLINQFGAARSITDLQSWSGNRAMLRYRVADKHIEKLQILP